MHSEELLANIILADKGPAPLPSPPGWHIPLENPGSNTDGYCLIFNPGELVTYIEWDPP